MRRYLRRRSILALAVVTLCAIEIILAIRGPWNFVLMGKSGDAEPHIETIKIAETKPIGSAAIKIPSLVKNVTTTVPAPAPQPDPTKPVAEAVPVAKLKDNNTTLSNVTIDNNQKNKPHNKTIEDLDAIIGNLTAPWISNATRRAGIRNKLNVSVDMPAGEFVILTKKNTVLGQNVTFGINTGLSMNISKLIYDVLPQESPMVNLTTKRCSVVGNSGILRNSHCGRDIDKADFVFRCNTPPLKGHEHHTGIKSSLSSINPSGVIGAKYRRLTSGAYRTKFLKDMKQYGDLLLPVYGVNIPAYKTCEMAIKLLQQKGSSTRGLIINPDHFRLLQDTWRKLGLKKRMTTGFYLASMALSVCDTVDLYGYWPFGVGIDHRPVTYHYYDTSKISKGVHNFDWEFDVLYQLHMSGVLRMHVGTC